MKAKIFLTQQLLSDDYDHTILRASLTDEWEEISKEDIDLIKKNIHKMNMYNNYALYPTLVILDEKPLAHRIDSIKNWIEEEKKRKEVAKAKRDATRKLRLEKKASKEEERERLLFEELKKKFKK